LSHFKAANCNFLTSHTNQQSFILFMIKTLCTATGSLLAVFADVCNDFRCIDRGERTDNIVEPSGWLGSGIGSQLHHRWTDACLLFVTKLHCTFLFTYNR